MRRLIIGFAAAAVVAACSTKNDSAKNDSLASASAADSAKPIVIVSGFNQPEAVRYDPDQDIYFVGNWGDGKADAKDNNGYISRVNPDGTMAVRQFIVGGQKGVTLSAPRG